MIRRFAIAFGVLFLAVQASGYAQEEEAAPEQPTWRAPARNQYEPTPDPTLDSSQNLDRFSNALAVPSDTEASAEPTPPPKPLPPSIIDPSPDQLGVPSDLTGLPDLSINTPWFEAEGLRFRLGPAQIRFDLDMNFGYSDNIFSINSPRIGDYITTISPTIEIGVGRYPRPRPLIELDDQANYFSLKYTPSFQFFASNSDQNTVNQSLAANGRYTFSRLTLDGNFSYIESTTPTPADVGRQEYVIYTTNVRASYALTQKTFFQLTLLGSYQEYLEIADSRTISVGIAPALAYQMGQKLRLTLGPVAGITYVENGGEQPYQTIQLGFTYDTLRKLKFRGMVGYQATQFEGMNPTGAKDFSSPIFSLGATYEIDQTSSLVLDLERSVSTAGTSNGQTYVNTTFSMGFEKRFWQRIQLDLNASFQSLNYQGGDSRTDTYLAFTSKVGYLFWRQRSNAYLIYTRTQRFSEVTLYEYDANFLGIGIGTQF